MPPRGGFSFTVGAQTTNAQQSFQQLAQQAQNSAVVIRRAFSGEVQFNTQRGQEQLKQLHDEATRLAQQIGRPVRLVVNTDDAHKQVFSLGQAFEAATRGAFRGAGLGAAVPIGVGFGAAAASAAAVAAGVTAITGAMRAGIEATIGYSSRLEQAQAVFRAFTGSTVQATAAIQELRRYADITPFNTEEVIRSGQVFIRVARGSREEMLELVKLAGQLAATNPLQGLEGATFAIQELLAGQTESIANRFNTSRAAIQRLREQGLQGIELVRAVVKEAGGSDELIANLANTMQGRASTLISVLQNIAQAGFQPLFERISAFVGETAQFLQDNEQQFSAWAAGIGEAVGTVFDAIKLLKEGLDALTSISGFFNPQMILAGGINRAFPQPAAQEQVTPPQPKDPTLEANKAAQREIGAQIAQNEGFLKRNAERQAEINQQLVTAKLHVLSISEEYELQITQLQRQVAAIQTVNYSLQQQRAQIQQGLAQNDLDTLAAQAPAGMRAAAAGRNVQLDAADKLLANEQRRLQINFELEDMQNRGRSALEEQARAAQDYARDLQQTVRDNAQARQDELNSLREVQKAEADLRTDRMNALKERLDGEGEVRDETLRGIREVIDAERERREEASITRRQQIEDADAAYQAETRAIENSQREALQIYDDRIQALRDKLDEIKTIGETSAERSLRQLDQAEREYQRRQSLASAGRSVTQATSISEAIKAVERFRELQHEQQVAQQRERLQEKIRQEREAEERRRFEIQQKISQIEAQQRQAQRQFEEQREQRQIARDNELEQRRQVERQADQQERQLRQQEEARIRELEAQNRAADQAAQQEIRNQQKADQEEERRARQELLALEKTFREQERADQAALQTAQDNARALGQAAEEERYQKNLARQKELDGLAAQRHAIELERLKIEDDLVKAQDTTKLAQLAADRVFLEDARATVDAALQLDAASKAILANPILARIQELKLEEDKRAAVYVDQMRYLEIQADRARLIAEYAKTTADLYQIQLDRLKDQQAEREAQIKKEGIPGEGASVGGSFADADTSVLAINDLTKTLHEGVLNAIQTVGNLFKSDESARQSTYQWVQGMQTDFNNAWGIASPSTFMINAAHEVVQGFVNGLQQAEPNMGQAMFNLFNNSYQGWVVPLFTGAGGIVESLNNLWAIVGINMQNSQQFIIDGMIAPFQYVITVYLPSIENNFTTSGLNSGTAWANGFNQTSPATTVANAMNQLTTLLGQYEQHFYNSGWNNAQSYKRGYYEAMQDFQPNPMGTSGQAGTPGYDPYSDPYLNRQHGGPVQRGQLYRINEDSIGRQFAEFFTEGTVFPSDLFSGAQGGGGGENVQINVNVANGAVQVNGAGDAALTGTAYEMGHAVARAIAFTLRSRVRQSGAPNPASPELPGAITG